ncbi:hypothetical protein ABPG72_000034 [Tetrahymena utriculariae]
MEEKLVVKDTSDQRSQVSQLSNGKKVDLESKWLHALVHTLTMSGYFHAVAFNLLTQLMVYANTINHMYLFCLGTVFGLGMGFGLSQNMNKRKIIVFADLVYAIGIAAAFLTYSYYMICSVFLGLSVSVCIFALLLDIKEFVPHSSYLAKHMSIYQIYYCIGLLVSQLTQINLNSVYNTSSGAFNAKEFGKGQLAFLIVTLCLVVIRGIVLMTFFRISTPFEIIRFQQPRDKFLTSVHKLYSVHDEQSIRSQVVQKYNQSYIIPENKSNPKFWQEVFEGFLLNFFAQTSGCQIFMNTQQINIGNENLQNLSNWLLLVIGLCGLVGSVVAFLIVNRYTRIRWAQIGLVSTIICQGLLAVFTKNNVDTFGIFCTFHLLINICFLQAIYSFSAQKFLEKGLFICHFGLWLGFFASILVFYYGFIQMDTYSPVSFIVFSATSFVGLVFISFYAEEPAECRYLESEQKKAPFEPDISVNGDNKSLRSGF